ncbi:hypothetical protein LA080_006770 [Diaporthe eres]|nr:hypothetical protein LA080_006770 [Diaporthe eres]
MPLYIRPHDLRGTICAIIATVQTWKQLPAIVFIISSWYRKNEQSKRFVVFLSAAILAGAFGSVLAGAITKGLDGQLGMETWRWLFVIEGVITVAAAFIVPFTLLDYPLTSKRLKSEERQLAYARLRADGITSRNDGLEHRLGHLAALRAAATNWRLIPLTLDYMVIIGSLSLAYFYPIFAAQLVHDKTNAQYMTAPFYGVALVVAVAICIIADKLPSYRAIFTSAILLLFGCPFSALSAGITSPTTRYILLCFINTASWSANALSLSYFSTVLGLVEPEVRAICLAIINGMGNLAQLYGTYIFTSSKAPTFVMGFAVYSALFAIGAAIYLCSYFIFRKYPYKPVNTF